MKIANAHSGKSTFIKGHGRKGSMKLDDYQKMLLEGEKTNGFEHEPKQKPLKKSKRMGSDVASRLRRVAESGVTPAKSLWADAAEQIERLEAILRKVKYMRQRQKQFLRDRTQKNLVEAKQAEGSVDEALEKWEKKK